VDNKLIDELTLFILTGVRANPNMPTVLGHGSWIFVLWVYSGISIKTPLCSNAIPLQTTLSMNPLFIDSDPHNMTFVTVKSGLLTLTVNKRINLRMNQMMDSMSFTRRLDVTNVSLMRIQTSSFESWIQMEANKQQPQQILTLKSIFRK
jgi:hypothetical protein